MNRSLFIWIKNKLKVLTRSRLLPQSLYAGIDFCYTQKRQFQTLTTLRTPNSISTPTCQHQWSFQTTPTLLQRPRLRRWSLVHVNDTAGQLLSMTSVGEIQSLTTNIILCSFWTLSVAGCQNGIVQGGVCVKHGAKRRQCKFPGCDKNSKSAGLCSKHGWVYLFTIHQHLGVLVLSHMSDSICHKPICHHHHLHHTVLLYTDPHAKSAKKKAVPT